MLDCVLFGRNIIENLRKFIQFSTVGSANLVFFVIIGKSLYMSDIPIQVPFMMFQYFVRTTFASLTTANELPTTRRTITVEPQFDNIHDSDSEYSDHNNNGRFGRAETTLSTYRALTDTCLLYTSDAADD